MTFVFIASYFSVALFAVFMTVLEQKQTGYRGFFLTMLGFIACLFWPITFLTAAIAAQRSA